MIMITNSLFIICFLTKLLSGILFSTAVNAVFVAKLLTSGILFCNSVNFVFFNKISYVRNFFSSSGLSGIYFSKEMYYYQYYLLLQLIYYPLLF